jgi:PleD family two-component response regulator
MRQKVRRTRIQLGDHPITLSGGLFMMRGEESPGQAVARADLMLYHPTTHGRKHVAAKESLKP